MIHVLRLDDEIVLGWPGWERSSWACRHAGTRQARSLMDTDCTADAHPRKEDQHGHHPQSATMALAATTLFGIGTGVAAAAEPTTPTQPAAAHSAQAQWSRGFNFHNTSTIPMIFADQSWPTGTPLGTVVPRASPALRSALRRRNDGELLPGSSPQGRLRRDRKIQFTLQIEGVANTNSTWNGEDGMSGFTATTDDRDVYVLDPGGTDITWTAAPTRMPKQDSPPHCTSSATTPSLAACQFDAKTEDPHAFGATHQVGISQVNGTNNQQV